MAHHNTSPDSNGSVEYDDIALAKNHAHHIEDLEKLKPTPSQFERYAKSHLILSEPTSNPSQQLYLAPETSVAGNLRWTFGNPTPIALAGFLLANTPASIDLMGWGGAGGKTGNTSAGIGAYYFLGAVLLYSGGIGEWILGNTFPAVVFFTFGGFWATFGKRPPRKSTPSSLSRNVYRQVTDEM